MNTSLSDLSLEGHRPFKIGSFFSWKIDFSPQVIVIQVILGPKPQIYKRNNFEWMISIRNAALASSILNSLRKQTQSECPYSC